MMFKIIFLLTCIIYSESQILPRVDYVDNSAPIPYQFSYTAPAEGGSSSHQETGDGNGRVTGSYTVEDDDGRSRIVEYVADEDGFRAAISTNEPGTSNQNPADVSIVSSAEDVNGAQVLQSPPVAPVAPVAVAAVSPINRVTPANQVTSARLTPRPVPQPVRRPALIPIQPALVPVQPALVPVEPRLVPVPVQPTFDQPRRFIIEPAIPSFGARGLFPGAALVPIGTRRAAEPSVLVPIDNTRLVPDPFFSSRNFFRSFDRNNFI